MLAVLLHLGNITFVEDEEDEEIICINNSSGTFFNVYKKHLSFTRGGLACDLFLCSGVILKAFHYGNRQTKLNFVLFNFGPLSAVTYNMIPPGSNILIHTERKVTENDITNKTVLVHYMRLFTSNKETRKP